MVLDMWTPSISDKFRAPDRPMDRPFRMCVADIFKGMGSGFTVTGKIEAGSVQCGDRILVMPIGEPATVKGWCTELHVSLKVCYGTVLCLVKLCNYKTLSQTLPALANYMYCRGKKHKQTDVSDSFLIITISKVN